MRKCCCFGVFSLGLITLHASGENVVDQVLVEDWHLDGDMYLSSDEADEVEKLLSYEGLLGEFQSWKMTFGKLYENKTEEMRRTLLWLDSLQMVEEHNLGDHPYELEMNEFADMTFEEFAKVRLMEPQKCSAQNQTWTSAAAQVGKGDVPNAKDWREEGIVSPVKNQGHCGSCWTFSTTGALEAHYTKKTGKRLLLSEQQLIDCAGGFNNFGCSGGEPSQAFEYIFYNKGIETEEEYPYQAKNGTKCEFDPKSHTLVQVKGSHNITFQDEDSLLSAVAKEGPVSVAFQVRPDFRLYKSGVYQSSDCKDGPNDVNHAVLAVGYGVENGTPYWIVKNSWGPEWGDQGYFKIVRGKNMCGIADCASFPIL